MAGISFEGVELRKLPPSFRIKIGQLLDVDDDWKKVMSQIPSADNPSLPKYTMEHVRLIERHGMKTGLPCGEILLDEWSTSGRRRPTVETFLDLLIQCRLFRVADYVASEILGIDTPSRPESGPAARISTDLEGLELEDRVEGHAHGVGVTAEAEGLQSLIEKLNNHDYSQGNLVPFSINVLKLITKDFCEDLCVGTGAFGSVYKLDLRQYSGPLLATKLLNPASTVMEDQFLTEIRVLSQYRHPNLLPLVGYCTNGPQYCLVYDFLERGSLLDALACKNGEIPLDWSKRMSILVGIAKGLHHLHMSKGTALIHRDIKSANILLTDSYSPKIGDFGLAKSLGTANQTSALTSTIIGTSAYMAPEAFRGDISSKMDIFSFGVIMLEVLTGLSPHDENREEGHDVVTYLEEVVEDDDILPWVDPKAGRFDEEQCIGVYRLSCNCRNDKRNRPLINKVLEQLQSMVTLEK